MDPISGTEDNDTLTGSTGNDTLLGLGGNDLLTGGDGNDSLRGGEGDDELRGEAGDDELWGNAGNDTLLGGAGLDALYGGDGDDVLDGNESTEWPGASLVPWLSGGPGNDTLDNGLLHYEADPEHVVLNGVIVNLSTSDQLVDSITIAARSARDGFGGTDLIGPGVVAGHASVLDDVWFAPDVPHYVFLRAGDDLYYGGSQGGLAIPGGGNDTIVGGGFQQGISYFDTDVDFDGLALQGIVADLAAGVVYDGWGGIDTVSGIEAVSGGTRDDRISGDAGFNALHGEGNDDTLRGGGANDFLDGGSGTDTAVFDGQSADYTITRVDAQFRITDNNLADGDDGSDTLEAMEIARFADREIVLGGNPANDEIIDLTGPGGGTVEGGRGNDTYLVDDPLDNPVEAPGQGVDTVRASVSWALGANLENLVLLGDGDLDGTGNAAANTLTGNSGRNRLDGSAGADTLIGGAGGDTYLIDDPRDLVIEEAGVTASSRLVAAMASGRGEGRDPYDLGDDADTIISLAGRAYYAAFVESGVMAEDSPARELIGNLLDNTGEGNSAGNLLSGGAGNDTLVGGAGLDVASFAGNSADYTVSVHTASVTVADTQGDDGTDTLTGFELLRFADKVIALPGIALREGTGTAETFDLSAAADEAAAGGPGDDTYLVASSGDALIEYANAGIDRVNSSVSWTLWEHLEQLLLTGSEAIDGAGNSAANQLTGNAAANTLRGYDGNDTLRGGAGSDTLIGGAGNDVYVVAGADELIEDAGSGIDTVQSSASWTLAATIEKLVLTGARAVSGTGNDSANSLLGNKAANTLAAAGGDDTVQGRAGNDVLNGGEGKDRLSGGTGADTFVFDSPLNAATNTDTITDFRPGIDRLRLDADVFSALAAGALPDAAFRAGADLTAAQDADDRILYDTSTGALYYDADGSGLTAAVRFAQLGTATHPALTASDFVIVA